MENAKLFHFCQTFSNVFAYFLSGKEYELENLRRFQQILFLKRVLNLPMILTADFNCTPEELGEKMWANMFQGFLLVPEDTTFTCTIGSSRLIDFSLVSNELRGWSGVER